MLKVWLQGVRRRLCHYRSESDLADEIRIHSEMETEDYLLAGTSPQDAKRIANVRPGNPRVAIEKVRDQEFVTRVEDCYRDIVPGIRALCKHPVFSVPAI